MSLSEYKKKRDFKQTAEPAAGKSARSKKHIFVIQRHHASHLHYDFRLEMDGVLKSWAVPKGPSLNPEDKRLAMAVEDHPYDYKDFQGEIPAGNYGAGYVYIWDKGTYDLLEENGKPFDKQALQEWHSGNLKIVMHGKKLKGEFALVKMKGREENSWLLIKHKDKYAVKGAYDAEEFTPQRVIDKGKGSAGGKKAAAPAPKKAAPKKAAAATAKKASPKKAAVPVKKKAPAGEPMKEWYKPMLATLVDEPFDREGWIFETKWDGYRAIAAVRDGKAELYSRNQLSFNEQYAPVKKAVEAIPHNVVLDGEVVVLGKANRSDFQSLQNYKTTKKGNLVYEVFDLLHLNGHELQQLTLLERKTLLQQIVEQLDDPLVQYSGHVEGKGVAFFNKAVKQGWEGIIAKEADSLYAEGARSGQWLKVKVLNRQEAVIAGYTAPRGSRKKMGALVLGVYEEGKLRYIGHCGGGFNERLLHDVYERLRPLETTRSPFDTKVPVNMPVTWVKPTLVCEVKFSEWTGGGHLRQPIFIAMRDDKPAKDVKRELPKHVTMKKNEAREMEVALEDAVKTPAAKKTGAPEKKAAAKKADAREKAAPAKKASAPERKAAPQKAAPAKSEATASKATGVSKKSSAMPDERVLTLNRQQVTLTNQNKYYWPKEKITKGQLIDYYLAVAPYLLPHLKDRPLSLNRFPNGINGPSFYQKDLDTATIPGWLKTEPVFSESNNKTVDYLVCNNEATLAYMINLGCIEVNPWLSRISKQENPDYVVIDLDPEDIAFRHVVDTANVVHEVLEGLGIQGFCKTSGATGLHIYIPVGAKYSYETSRLFAELVAREAHSRLPDVTSVVRAKSKRQKRVYIDFLQNSRGQTIAAPYSARPKPGATVSTPLHWEEVNGKLDVRAFHIGNTLDRLKTEGELWEKISTIKNDLKAVVKSYANG
ncbi:non-homologous end-joining DNA ligase [Chitinophaga lutea]